MKRIVIIGLPGSGKSTFADRLGKTLEIPVHHLDKHMFEAEGKKRDREEFLKIQQALVDEEAWIIEGCSIATLEMRYKRADLILYFQLPRFVCIWRVLKRLITKDVSASVTGCANIFSGKLLRYIWNFAHEKGPAIDALRKQYPKVGFRVLNGSRAAKQFINEWKEKTSYGTETF